MKKLKIPIFYILLIVLPIIIGIIFYGVQTSLHHSTIPVGILYSQTGPTAISEQPIIDAILLAIKEINTNGGLLGKQIEPIIADGMSDHNVFAEQAQQLISENNVAIIFGCWTSESRKAVIPIVEKENRLLLYSTPYEGLEETHNVIYTGATANQQILPSIAWCFNKFGPNFLYIGSDSIYCKRSYILIKTYLDMVGGSITNKLFLPHRIDPKNISQTIESIISMIKTDKPTCIINTIEGNENITFFTALKQANISAKQLPVMSFTIGEGETTSMGYELFEGHYAGSSYFQQIQTPGNKLFLKNIHEEFGPHKVASENDACAYMGVMIWAKAVTLGQSIDPQVIKEHIKNLSIDGPEGPVVMDQENLHAWKQLYIGKVAEGGQFRIIWDQDKPLYPEPYPLNKTKNEWVAILEKGIL